MNTVSQGVSYEFLTQRDKAYSKHQESNLQQLSCQIRFMDFFPFDCCRIFMRLFVAIPPDLPCQVHGKRQDYEKPNTANKQRVGFYLDDNEYKPVYGRQ